MRFSTLQQLNFSPAFFSSKTGWGGYRLHRKFEHFVGTEPSLLKYHHVIQNNCYLRLLHKKNSDSGQKANSELWTSRYQPSAARFRQSLFETTHQNNIEKGQGI